MEDVTICLLRLQYCIANFMILQGQRDHGQMTEEPCRFAWYEIKKLVRELAGYDYEDIGGAG